MTQDNDYNPDDDAQNLQEMQDEAVVSSPPDIEPDAPPVDQRGDQPKTASPIPDQKPLLPVVSTEKTPVSIPDSAISPPPTVNDGSMPSDPYSPPPKTPSAPATQPYGPPPDPPHKPPPTDDWMPPEANQGAEMESVRNDVDDLRAIVAELQDGKDLYESIFPATAPGDGTWKEAVPSSTGTTLETPSTLRQNTNATGYPKLLKITDLDPKGVWIIEMRFAGGHRYFSLGSGDGGGLFPVLLDESSGDGDATPFNYDIYAETDTGLTTPIASDQPQKTSGVRLVGVKMIAATDGIGYTKADGTTGLYVAFETWNQTTCSLPSDPAFGF